MVQCFNNQRFSCSFQDETIPVLLYSCKTSDNFINMPRAMHMHEDKAEVVFITSGSGTHYIGGRQYFTKKGDILLYNAGVLHDETANPSGSMNVFCIAVSNLRIKGQGLNQFIPDNMGAVLHVGERYHEFLNLFEMIHSHTINCSPRGGEVSNYLIRTLIVMIYDLIDSKTSVVETEQFAAGQRVKDYIDQHYLEDINLNTIAQNLNMNQYYLAHLFKDMSGYSPMQYVIRRRIGEAQSMLINTNYPVTQIATMVGYNNSNHFHAAFVKMVGMTPYKYRKYWVKEKEK